MNSNRIDSPFKEKKIAEIRLNSLKKVYEDLNETCKLASVVDTYCKHSMGSEEIYNISAVVKLLYKNLEEVTFNLNKIIDNETDFEMPEFFKKINLNDPDIELDE